MITPAQCRGARAMLQMKQQDLADQARLTRRTLALFEAETRAPRHQTLQLIRQALEAMGAVFVDSDIGHGVLLARGSVDEGAGGTDASVKG